MGGGCGTYGGEERRNLGERDNLEELGLDGGIILKMDVIEACWGRGLD